MWEGLREPVQVVWRKAAVEVEEVEVDGGGGDVGEQLYERFNPRRNRIDVRRAPLLRLYIAEDREQGCWVMLQLLHHLVMDHSTLEVLQTEIQAHMQGQAERLPAPQPFRNLIAEARLGGSKEEHEEYLPAVAGRCGGTYGSVWAVGRAGRWERDSRSSPEVDAEIARRIRARAPRVAGKRSESVPPGLGVWCWHG